MGSLTTLAILCALALLVVYRRRTRNAISQIPGPKPKSFFLGNMPELLQSQAGEADLKWQEEFGDVIRLYGPLGEPRLLISDPKAIQHIYQTAGYGYPKLPERREISLLTSGPGIIYQAGHDHQRHRKVMKPAFGAPETRALLPLFSNYAAQLTAKWNDALSDTLEQSMVFDLPSWLSRATLDTIGEAAFDYRFGALDNAQNELGNAYFNLLADAFGSPSNGRIFMAKVSRYLPRWFSRLLRANSPQIQRLKNTEKIATSVARSLLDMTEDAFAQGKGKRDVMSLLVKANASENEQTRLGDTEVLAQMRTMMLAGHETTANTLSWMLLELARRPDLQDKLRAEIRAAEQAVHARGDSAFSASDLENMEYLSAVVKEGLRVNPVAYMVERITGKDDVVPLSTPITTLSGQVLHELVIPQGTRIAVSVFAYNRHKDVFGANPHDFRPERWLDGSIPKRTTSVGVYANLFTFSGGLQACIGWRFALLEMQAFLVELINNFEFTLTPDVKRLRREACLVMVPTLEGEVEKGAQLPLLVRPASRQ